MLETEAKGQPWNAVAWLTDPAEAAKRAAEQDRPLLVYAFLRKKVGPAAAPG